MNRTFKSQPCSTSAIDKKYARGYTGMVKAIATIQPGDEIMLGTQVTCKGTVTVPKEVREALQLGVGDKVFFVADGDHAIMIPLKRDIWSVRGAFKKYAKGKSSDWKKIKKDMQRWRAHRQAEILSESRGRAA